MTYSSRKKGAILSLSQLQLSSIYKAGTLSQNLYFKYKVNWKKYVNRHFLYALSAS